MWVGNSITIALGTSVDASDRFRLESTLVGVLSLETFIFVEGKYFFRVWRVLVSSIHFRIGLRY